MYYARSSKSLGLSDFLGHITLLDSVNGGLGAGAIVILLGGHLLINQLA